MSDPLPLVQVRLLGVPLALRAQAQEYDQDLMRELALVRVGADQPETAEVPAELLRLADEVQTSYAAFSAAPNAEMDQALDEGLEHLDVTYGVPPHTLSFVRRVRRVLDQVQEMCREGRLLLTPAASPEVTAYRAWVFDEFERQMEGAGPVAWADVAPGQAAPRSPADARGARSETSGG